MKVIDLLNKIANGEETPKKIRVGNSAFELSLVELNGSKHYSGNTESVLNNVLGMAKLNDEVEIIEEEKKIPEKLESYISCGWNGTCKDLKRDELFEDLKKIGNKINEIIDYLQSKGDK